MSGKMMKKLRDICGIKRPSAGKSLGRHAETGQIVRTDFKGRNYRATKRHQRNR